MRLSIIFCGLLALNLGFVGCWSNKDIVARDNAGGATATTTIGTSGGQQTPVNSLTQATMLGGAVATGGATQSGGTPTSGTIANGGKAGIGGDATGGLFNTGSQLTSNTGGGSNIAAGGSNVASGGTNSGGISEVPSGGKSAIDERPNPPCEGVEDCRLVSDCCTCDVYGATAQGPSCDIAECKASQCELKSIDASDITCVGGRCTFLRSCDDRWVTCPQAAPNCPTGQLPMIESDCYSGDCTTVTSCRDVPSCDTCTAQGLSCAMWNEMRGLTYHCVNTPLDCNDTTDCKCMGVCAFGFVCNYVPDQPLACVCPGC